MQYILIDHENVQPADLAGLGTSDACVLVFTGAQQKVDIRLIESVQSFGERGRFIRINGNGRNALDFHIAFYLGQLTIRDPGASFLVVSNDTGYDPLIAHLGENGTRVRRVGMPVPAQKPKQSPAPTAAKPVAKAPVQKPATAKKAAPPKAAAPATAPTPFTPKADAARITSMLKGMPTGRPRTPASLRRMIATWLSSKDASRLDKVLAELQRLGVIGTVDNKLAYKLPKS